MALTTGQRRWPRTTAHREAGGSSRSTSAGSSSSTSASACSARSTRATAAATAPRRSPPCSPPRRALRPDVAGGRRTWPHREAARYPVLVGLVAVVPLLPLHGLGHGQARASDGRDDKRERIQRPAHHRAGSVLVVRQRRADAVRRSGARTAAKRRTPREPHGSARRPPRASRSRSPPSTARSSCTRRRAPSSRSISPTSRRANRANRRASSSRG